MSEKEPKYKTLAELKAAYESGELDREASPLVLDNDCSYVYVRGEDESGVDDVCVYRGPGYEIREEALTLAGIPWENC
jgi:hypothetical protein